MKRFYYAVIGLALCAAPVYASVFSIINDKMIDGAVTLLFTAGSALLCAFFGHKYSIAKFKAPVLALIQVYRRYKAGKRKQSEEGTDLSKTEWNEIFADMTVAVEGIVALLPAKWVVSSK